MKAQNYLYSELQLPELEIPIPVEENPSNNSETNWDRIIADLKRPKKRQSSE